LNTVKPQQNIQVSQDSVNELKKQIIFFDQSNSKLKARDKELYNMISNAIKGKDNLRANMFANELVRVRHLQRVFSQSQLVMECITLRMENLLDLYNAIQLEPISKVIKEIVVDIQGISPEFISGLEQLTKLASDTLKQTTINFQQPALDEVFSAKSPESIEILNEVSNTIENCLQESFPEPPVTTQIIEKQVEAIEYGSEPTFTPQKATINNGVNDLSILSEDVVKMIDSLTIKNQVKIEDK
jgi:division protein CdvB (Snf7/Vps24/ESCRT-III family)